MKSALSLLVLMFITTTSLAQFNVASKGEQTFKFKDDRGRNQATFFSNAPLEAINGMTSEIQGSVSFNPDDVAGTLKGQFSFPVASIKTGIDLRDEHLLGENWLNAEKNPNVKFEIKKVNKVEKLEDNKLKVNVTGMFTLNGVTNEVTTDVTMTYLKESEQTKTRFPGDLLGVYSKFNLKLSEFNVKNQLIGQKVAENIEVTVSIVGSNKI